MKRGFVEKGTRLSGQSLVEKFQGNKSLWTFFNNLSIYFKWKRDQKVKETFDKIVELFCC